MLTCSWFVDDAQCFTYATMFSIESLALAGETYANSEAVRRACGFILGKQMDDGGWGESYKVRLSSLLQRFLRWRRVGRG